MTQDTATIIQWRLENIEMTKDQIASIRRCHACRHAAGDHRPMIRDSGESPTVLLDAVMAGMNKALGLPPELSAEETLRLAKRKASP
jgi:hypothetical protein